QSDSAVCVCSGPLISEDNAVSLCSSLSLSSIHPAWLSAETSAFFSPACLPACVPPLQQQASCSSTQREREGGREREREMKKGMGRERERKRERETRKAET